jgi:hypothetical protein
MESKSEDSSSVVVVVVVSLSSCSCCSFSPSLGVLVLEKQTNERKKESAVNQIIKQ